MGLSDHTTKGGLRASLSSKKGEIMTVKITENNDDSTNAETGSEGSDSYWDSISTYGSHPWGMPQTGFDPEKAED